MITIHDIEITLIIHDIVETVSDKILKLYNLDCTDFLFLLSSTIIKIYPLRPLFFVDFARQVKLLHGQILTQRRFFAFLG